VVCEGVVDCLGEAFAGLGGGFVAKDEIVGVIEEGFDDGVPFGFIGKERRTFSVVFVEVGCCFAGDVEAVGYDLASVACFGFCAGDHLLG